MRDNALAAWRASRASAALSSSVVTTHDNSELGEQRTSRDGTTLVIRHGSRFEVLATNTLDDGFDASPALVDNELYLRGNRYLYCIAEP